MPNSSVCGQIYVCSVHLLLLILKDRDGTIKGRLTISGSFSISGEPGLVDRVLALHAGSRGFDSHRGHMSERFFRSNRPGYPHPVSSELENSGIRVAVGDCRSLNVGGGVCLSNRQNCTCARKTLQTQQGRTHGAGCVRQWLRTAEPLGERRYENWYPHTLRVILSLELKCQHLQSAKRIIIYGNSGSLIGWINFYTFTCTGNIAMCWEPDPTAEKSCLKSANHDCSRRHS